MDAAPVLLPPSSPLPLQQVQADTERRFLGELAPLSGPEPLGRGLAAIVAGPLRGAVSWSWLGIWLAAL